MGVTSKAGPRSILSPRLQLIVSVIIDKRKLQPGTFFFFSNRLCMESNLNGFQYCESQFITYIFLNDIDNKKMKLLYGVVRCGV